MAKLLLVIESETRAGNGRAEPVRIVTQYWTADGELLAERDPLYTVDTLRDTLLHVYAATHDREPSTMLRYSDEYLTWEGEVLVKHRDLSALRTLLHVGGDD